NTSPGSIGLGGVPMKNNSAPCGCRDWFVAATMSSSAFSVRICASSKTSMSISSKPRPKPCSRAPNMMTEPLRNPISCSPLAVRDARRHLLATRVPLQMLEGVRSRPGAVRCPDHPQAGKQRRQREHDPANQERLGHLAGNRQRDTADGRRIDAIRALAEDQLTGAALPLVELVAPLVALRLNVMPSGRDDPRRVDDVACDLR